MTPRVSIIINCYNGEKYLAEALRSVIAQTFLDWELIFWNNKSTDSSKEVFFSFSDPRLIYCEAQEHTTLGKARKLALEQARGTWVGFLDCDDIWYPDKLALQLSSAEVSLEPVGMVYCDTDFITCNSGGCSLEYTSKSINGMTRLPEGEIFSELCNSCFFTLVSVLFNRIVLIKSGGINPYLKHAEDYDMFLKVAAISQVVAVDKVCCAYRLHDSNLTSMQRELAYIEPIMLLNGYSGRREVKNALGAWRAAFALWSFRHCSFRHSNIWLFGLLSPQFPGAVVRQFVRIYRKRNIRKKNGHRPL